MKYLSFLFVFVLFFNCKNEASKTELNILNANEIINKSIAVSGGDKFKNSNTVFNFRNKKYLISRNDGNYHFERRFQDSLTQIHDVLTNNGFERTREGVMKVRVADSMVSKYSSSINSVQYFASLPYGLNDEAVNKKLLGEERIKEKDYYVIEVTFNQEGGGEDYEDVFVYWINKETFKPDYLAYSYDEDDGRGMRFREAYNERYIKGLRFVDYNNYKSEDKSIQITELAKAFHINTLTLLSKIELENVRVELVNL